MTQEIAIIGIIIASDNLEGALANQLLDAVSGRLARVIDDPSKICQQRIGDAATDEGGESRVTGEFGIVELDRPITAEERHGLQRVESVFGF